MSVIVESNVILDWLLEIVDVAARPQGHESSVIIVKSFRAL